MIHLYCMYQTLLLCISVRNKENLKLNYRFCGVDLPPVLTSSDNVLTVMFSSDSSVSHEGFTASYVALNASTGNVPTTPAG